MEQLRIGLKVVTPLFMYGAERDKPEIRVASLKGVIRFWYRAVLLSRLKSWKSVKKEEDRVFGDGGKDGHRANFLLKIVMEQPTVANEMEVRGKHGLIYLGHGLFRGVQRSFIAPGNQFDLVIVFKTAKNNEERGMTGQDIRDLELALLAMHFFGGIGTRSRRGFGSLNIVSWEATYKTTQGFAGVPVNKEELRESIYQWLKIAGPFVEGLPDYTAFCSDTRSVLWGDRTTWQETMNEVGRTFLTYRTSGQNNNAKNNADPAANRILPWHAPVTPRFWVSDHNQMVIAKYSAPSAHPRRIVFGLPHNYRFSDKNNVSVNVWRDRKEERQAKNEERRASPLFIHLHELHGETKKQYVAVICAFPAAFLLSGDKIRIKGPRITTDFVPDVDYAILNELLDQFTPRLEVL